MGSLGFSEMLLVMVVAIIMFGKDLPAIARKAGKWYFNLKRQLTDIKDELKAQIPDTDDLDVTKDLRELRDDAARGFADVDKPPAESPAPSPSAGLPGPDPGDPEFKPHAHEAPFDPAPPPPQSAPPPEGPGPDPKTSAA